MLAPCCGRPPDSPQDDDGTTVVVVAVCAGGGGGSGLSHRSGTVSADHCFGQRPPDVEDDRSCISRRNSKKAKRPG
jgi:hypothetical protein